MAEFITVTQDGVTVTTGAVSARVALPTDSGGGVARFVRIAATSESYVRLGGSAVVATANSFLIQPSDSATLSTNGATHIAYIQGAASAKVSVSPLD